MITEFHENVQANRKVGRTMKEDEVRALLIQMRQYIIYHGILMGECVAWNKLKELYGVGIDDVLDEKWLREYRENLRCKG